MSKMTPSETKQLHSSEWIKHIGDARAIWIQPKNQRLLLIENTQVLRSWICSTAKAGLGQQNGSGCTPTGWHEIGEKIGGGLPEGAILKGRKWTGEVWRDGDERNGDLILSRAMWLRGLETGHNLGGDVDTWSRYIYIHGTNQPELLGQSVSHGCIRLSNAAVMELFELVDVGTKALISAD